jgi:hypothetical protein
VERDGSERLRAGLGCPALMLLYNNVAELRQNRGAKTTVRLILNTVWLGSGSLSNRVKKESIRRFLLVFRYTSSELNRIWNQHENRLPRLRCNRRLRRRVHTGYD